MRGKDLSNLDWKPATGLMISLPTMPRTTKAAATAW